MSQLREGALLSAYLAAGGGALLLILGLWREATILTASCAVVIINGLWLERVLWHVAQPRRPRWSRAVAWHTVGRLALLAAFAALVYVVRKHVGLWAAALGITLGVLGWVWAGLRSR